MLRFVLCLVPCFAWAQVEQGPANAGFMPEFDGQTRTDSLPASSIEVSIFSEGLDFPWGIAPLPDGGFLVSERDGLLKRLGADGGLVGIVSGLPDVAAVRKGGLLDVAVSPAFDTDRLVYWTYEKPFDGGTALAAAQGILDEITLTQVVEIFVQDPVLNSGQHYGSRIIPTQDGVWITTGDRGSPELAQGDNTVGKIIWIDRDGPRVWSSGHRNIQGATVRDGTLWTVEHGPQGGDELNQPEDGLNYGWPVVSYGINYGGSDVGDGIAVSDGYEPPVYYWDPVIAPGGMAANPEDGAHEAWRGNLFVSSLRPVGVMRLELDDGHVVGEEHLLADVGRVRDVEVLDNGDLLVLPDALGADILRVSPLP